MSEKTKDFYRFDEFRLDLAEKVLQRDGETISLTPKVFETLCVLVENSGRLIEKDELMRLIWQERFVDEGNLTFNIRMLRVALGDTAQNSQFIETVPRRGYRFVAAVERISQPINETVRPRETFQPIAAGKPIKNNLFKRLKLFAPVAATLCLLIIAVGFGSRYSQSGSSLAVDAPILFAPFNSEKLSTNGKVRFAVLSPDGKTVLYRNQTGDEQSIWLRQLATGNNTEVIPPTNEVYYGLKFAPAGDFIYFSRGQRSGDRQTEIYRVSVFGGAPTKIISEAQGWFSISRDNTKISFVRCYYREEENCSLWTADALDGRHEKKLVARPRPFRISANEISPDGKTIAFAVGQSENQSNDFGLREVNIETGAENEITAEKFFDIKSLIWLPSQDDLLVTASKIPNRRFRIWQIPHGGGAATALTKDSDDYATVSLDASARLIAAVQFKADFKLLVQKMGNSLDARVLSDATRARFAPNNKILFASTMFGNPKIWICDVDGSNLRQLTSELAEDSYPLDAPELNSIFFSSNRTGAVHVWRMNPDGSGQTQITKNDGGFPLSLSADKRWIYYLHGIRRTLWRVSVDGDGTEELILDKQKYDFALSPDNTQVAFSEKQGENRVLTVVSLTDGQIIKTFPAPVAKARIGEIEWLADGATLGYILVESNQTKSLWLQPIDGDAAARSVADFGDDEITSLSFAPDSQTFAVVQGVWKHDAVLLKGLK